MVLSPLYGQTVVYVDANATGADDGTSWSHAFTSLQNARERAISDDIGEIWVAEGTYYPDRGASVTQGDRTATFQLTSGIAIYGGFAGGESDRGERDPEANEVVLSGDIGIPNDASDNSYHVVTGSGADATAVLNGVTVTAGHADGEGAKQHGAGMYVNAGSPTVRDVVFTGNTAEGRGGGMYNVDGSAPTVEGGIFRDNAAFHGGGMFNDGSSPTVREATFASNSVEDNGGGINNFNGSSPLVEQTYFLGNAADTFRGDGGGMFNTEDSAPTIERCFFGGNSANNGGGGLRNGTNATVITNTVFSGNTAGGNGGAIHGSPARIVNSTFSENEANGNGGGLFVVRGRKPVVHNTILSGDAASTGDEISLGFSAELLVGSSLVQGGLPDGVQDGGSNVVGNPRFANHDGPDGQVGTRDDNLDLQEESLGIDIGSNQALDLNSNGDVTDDLPVDFAGNTRIYDGDGDGEDVVDMGAYERQSLAPPSNLAASVSGGNVELTWDESSRTGITRYNVYRSTSSFSDVAEATKLNDSPLGMPSYTDTNVQSGATYYYRVTGVGGDGQESGLSDEVRATLETAEFFAWPVDEPRIPQDHATYNSGFANRHHLGVDFISADGSFAVYAAAAGEVVLEGSEAEGTEDDAYGTYVVIDHGNNLYALYAHLASKEDKQSVEQGERIGTMGESGDAEGIHLHLDVMARSSKPDNVEAFDNGYHTGHPSRLGHPDPKTYLKQRVVRVNTPTLNVREGPSLTSALVGGETTIEQDQELVSVGPPVGEWYFIYLPYDVIPSTGSYRDYDRYGWVHGQYLEVGVAGRSHVRVDGKAIAAAEGPGKYLNVRSSPNASSNALTKVWGGQRFVTIGSPVNGSGSDEPWYQIHLPEKAGATEGWVAGDFVKVVNADPSDALVATTKTVNSDGVVNFGGTGVDVAFTGVGGSQDVEVAKFGNAPIGASGFAESNVSNYRFIIKAEEGLNFGSNTEVRLDVSTLAGVGDASKVKIYQRSATGQGMFTALSTQYDAENNELVATTDSFSEFVLASNTEPLPVELANFDAAVKAEEVLLKWRTASETNNSGFAVQRRASSSGSWTRLIFIDGVGTTSAPQTYRYRDTNIPYEADSLVYRLKQVDADGSTSLSEPITVGWGAPEEVKLLGTYPNPARNQATIRYALPRQQEVTLRLYDALGRKVATLIQGKEDAGRSQLQLGTSDLSSGVYFLRLTTEGVVKTERLTVVR